MARGRKATGPKYYASRGAYYTKFKGVQYCLAVGPEGGETLLKAYLEFARVTNGIGAAQQTETAPESTVSQVISRYLLWVKRHRKHLTHEMRRYSLTDCLTHLGPIKVKHLTRQMVEEYQDSKQAWSGSSHANFLNGLQAALNWAVKDGQVEKNPLKGKMEVKVGRSRGKECLIYPADHEQLMKVVSEEFRGVLAFLDATGCRSNELCKLMADYWSPAAECFALPSDPDNIDSHKTAHTGKTRIIFVPPDLVPMIKDLIKKYPTGKLFRRKIGGKPWTSQSIALRMRYYCDKLGLSHQLTPYSYRHSYCTAFLLNGGPNKSPGSAMILAELVGTSLKMLSKQYGHLDAFVKGLQGYAAAFARIRKELIIG